MFEETEEKDVPSEASPKEVESPESLPVEPSEIPELAPEETETPAPKAPPIEVEPKVAETGPKPAEPEDIFAETEAKPTPKLVPQEAKKRARELAKVSPGARFPFKRICILLVAVAIIGGLVFGGWWGYQKIKVIWEERGAEESALRQSADGGEEPEGPTSGSQEPTEKPIVLLDTDGDGLSDAEEKTLGTAISLADTDKDGLFDGEEVKIYKTDPLKPDSDSDGYPDGTEVKNGYDPLDPSPGAKLFNLEEEIDKLD